MTCPRYTEDNLRCLIGGAKSFLEQQLNSVNNTIEQKRGETERIVAISRHGKRHTEGMNSEDVIQGAMRIVQLIYLKRLGDPRVIGKTICYLLHEVSGHVNVDQALQVDKEGRTYAAIQGPFSCGVELTYSAL